MKILGSNLAPSRRVQTQSCSRYGNSLCTDRRDRRVLPGALCFPRGIFFRQLLLLLPLQGAGCEAEVLPREFLSEPLPKSSSFCLHGGLRKRLLQMQTSLARLGYCSEAFRLHPAASRGVTRAAGCHTRGGGAGSWVQLSEDVIELPSCCKTPLGLP